MIPFLVSIIYAQQPGNPFPFPPKTSYIPITKTPGNSIFYWLFEPKSAPTPTTPLIIYLDGGPGCGSTYGLFHQIGPFYVDSYIKNKPISKLRGNSWNENAYVLFADQPLGIGFSTVTPGNKARNRQELQEQWIEFFQKFLVENPKMQNRDIFVVGLSYGGHYAPYIADVMIRNGIRVKGVGIVNGYMKGKTMLKTYPEFSVQMKKYTNFQEKDQEELQPIVDLCEQMLDFRPNPMLADRSACLKVSKRINDIAKKFNPQFDEQYMPSDFKYNYTFVDFLNDEKVQKLIGVDKLYKPCDSNWGAKFGELDYYIDSSVFVAKFLESGVKVLIFDGDLDWLCNYYQEEHILSEMKWSGRWGWNSKKLEKCEFGLCKEFANLRYVRLKGAGHKAMLFQPDLSLKLINELIGKG